MRLSQLSRTVDQLNEVGFTILPGPVAEADLDSLKSAYDAAIATAAPEDVHVGSSTTRVDNLVNRSPEFDCLYLHPPVLEACQKLFHRPFKLSALHARTLRPCLHAQNLHVDYARDHIGWTLLGFIFLVDDFNADNGATRFLPGSHHWTDVPPELARNPKADFPGQVKACGPAGSMILFNGSVLHGHTVNRSGHPRRSIQGAYIRRDLPSPADLPSRIRPETFARLGPLAKHLLALETQPG